MSAGRATVTPKMNGHQLIVPIHLKDVISNPASSRPLLDATAQDQMNAHLRQSHRIAAPRRIPRDTAAIDATANQKYIECLAANRGSFD